MAKVLCIEQDIRFNTKDAPVFWCVSFLVGTGRFFLVVAFVAEDLARVLPESASVLANPLAKAQVATSILGVIHDSVNRNLSRDLSHVCSNLCIF
jgi:hypothetical protein